MSLMVHDDITHALIIGADVIARLGLRTLLLVSGRVAIVGEVTLAQDGILQVGQHRPDVVLLHGTTFGSDLLTELRELTRRVPVLVLTNDDSPASVERALRVGATGYLVNGQYDSDELVAAVLATAKGQPRLSPAAVRVLVDRLRIVPTHHESVRPSRLSSRETEIVDHLVRGRTNAEIARSLGISEKTVKNHVNHVYVKLHTRNRAETVAFWLRPDHDRNAES
jgi:DNA-binding NarL/FixJ family response regulator